MDRIDLANIKNIIFDLGIVLLDLDFEKAKSKFEKLGMKDMDRYYSIFDANSFFHNFETGKISEEDFIHELKHHLPNGVSNKDIYEAWNAIIAGFPTYKIDILKNLYQKYRIFLMSNTNMIHARKYEAQFQKQAGISIHEIFEKVYYSHDMGLRKPDAKIFEIILKNHQLKAEETLFIDDIEANLVPARSLRIHTIRYERKMNLFTIFNMQNNNLF